MRAKKIIVAVTVLILAIAMACALVACDNEYTVSLTRNNEQYGYVSGSGTYKEGDTVTISATANKGYVFVGWYNGDSLISTDSDYSFIMGYNNISYMAKFDYLPNVVLECDSTRGTVTGDKYYLKGSNVTITATAKDGYSFIGWYNGEEVVSTDANYNFVIGDSDVELTAKFSVINNAVILQCDSEKGSVSGSGEYDYGDFVTIMATPNEGYYFDGWYDGETLISHSIIHQFFMRNNGVIYTAKFVAKTNSVIIINDSNEGSVTGGGNTNTAVALR